MRVLLIYGDDYAALHFEEHMGIDEARKIIDSGGKINVSEDEYAFTGRVYEFGDVDSKFIQFVRDDVQDYDDIKHSNFYIL